MACLGYDFETAYTSLREGYRQLSQAPLDENTFWENLSSLTQRAVTSAQDALRTEVSELFSCPCEIAVAYTGSDSRLEKCGLGSPLECIVITPCHEMTPSQRAIVDKISEVCNKGSRIFSLQVEQKALDHDLVATYKHGDPPTVIPTRACDAAFLGGDEETFKKYKQKLCQELGQEHINLKLFRKKFLDSALQNLRQELNGSPVRVPYITLDSGTVFYEKTGRRGLKHDIFRSVQYSLAYKIFCLMSQEGKVLPDDIPRTVMGRLDWLSEKKFISLSDEEITQLKKNYTQASYWYLLLNEQVVSSPDPDKLITMKLESRTLRPVIQGTLDICKKIGE